MKIRRGPMVDGIQPYALLDMFATGKVEILIRCDSANLPRVTLTKLLIKPSKLNQVKNIELQQSSYHSPQICTCPRIFYRVSSISGNPRGGPYSLTHVPTSAPTGQCLTSHTGSSSPIPPPTSTTSPTAVSPAVVATLLANTSHGRLSTLLILTTADAPFSRRSRLARLVSH
jgi:hypothetical protein